MKPARLPVQTVITKEVARLAAPGGEDFIAATLARATGCALDRLFCDPSIAGTTSTPASITYGISAHASSGGDVLEDLRTLLSAHVAGGASLASTVLLLSSGDAVALSLRSGSNANPMFPGLTAAGGVLAGLPALASDEVGPRLIAVDTSKIVLVDNGEVEIDRATIPAVQMVTNPSSSATSLVSLFQTDSILLRVLRRLTWARVEDSAVTWVDSVGYLHEGGSPSA